MNLTQEQLDLLKKIAGVYNSGYKSNFRFARVHRVSNVLVHNSVQGSLVFLDGGPTIPSDAFKEDFKQLAAEGFLQIDIEGAGLVEGKITAKGLAAVAPPAASQRVPDRLPPPPPGPVNPPASVRVSLPPKWEQPLVLQRRPEPPGPQQVAEIVSASTKPVGKPHVVFIGHGHGKDWVELDQFLTKKLKLECIEFNSSSAAGLTTQKRLEQMLDQATFAFLVMTAEDPQPDGTLQARQNVIHEAGLFQGRLGFDKAILLVEAGCKGFSNIHGLTYISFRAGEIESSFHRVREVLEDRGIISH